MGGSEEGGRAAPRNGADLPRVEIPLPSPMGARRWFSYNGPGPQWIGDARPCDRKSFAITSAGDRSSGSA